tara:strand:+ start:17 stop:238 length:222 start_codon:yes stop_codon:yes gene_type:complete
MLFMVFKRHTFMSEEEYKLLCYSKAEAAAIVEEEARLELERAKVANKVRTGTSDMKAAIELGITLEEYRRLVL